MCVSLTVNTQQELIEERLFFHEIITFEMITCLTPDNSLPPP